MLPDILRSVKAEGPRSGWFNCPRTTYDYHRQDAKDAKGAKNG